MHLLLFKKYIFQPKEEPVQIPEQKKPAIVEVNKVSKPLHKSESLKEPSKREILQSSLSLEDARRFIYIYIFFHFQN